MSTARATPVLPERRLKADVTQYTKEAAESRERRGHDPKGMEVLEDLMLPETAAAHEDLIDIVDDVHYVMTKAAALPEPISPEVTEPAQSTEGAETIGAETGAEARVEEQEESEPRTVAELKKLIARFFQQAANKAEALYEENPKLKRDADVRSAIRMVLDAAVNLQPEEEEEVRPSRRRKAEVAVTA